jgi:hypothetical protein
MAYVWQITIKDYIEVVELAKARGKQPGDSMEKEFLEIMNKKGNKPKAETNKNLEELNKDLNKAGFKTLNLSKILHKERDNKEDNQ